MTRNEVENAIHTIIQNAVERSGDTWRNGYWREVHAIFAAMGKLAPEPPKSVEVPHYDERRVRRPRAKIVATPEQAANARAILRRLGMI
jgi:hypothetical protein